MLYDINNVRNMKLSNLELGWKNFHKPTKILFDELFSTEVIILSKKEGRKVSASTNII